MGNTAFGWENTIDRAIITASSEVATLPVANLQNTRKGRVWRTAQGVTTAWFFASWTGPTSIGVLALAGATLSETDQVQHQLYDGSGVLLYDTTVDADVLDGYGLHVHVLPSAVASVRQWKCTITATSRASQQYFDIKRAFASPLFTPEIGMSTPWEKGWIDDADKQRSRRSGAVLVGDGARYRTTTVNLNWLSKAEADEAEDMAYSVGVRNQLLCIPALNGDVNRDAILGRMERVPLVRQNKDTTPATFEQSFTIIQDF